MLYFFDTVSHNFFKISRTFFHSTTEEGNIETAKIQTVFFDKYF